MKKIALIFTILVGLSSFSQTGFSDAACEIESVYKGNLVKRESRNIQVGLDEFSQDFVAVINFDDFILKDNVTGKSIEFDEVIMKIKGQIPLKEMQANDKQAQNYQTELEIIFSDVVTMTSVFDIVVEYFETGNEGFRVVVMKTEIPIDDSFEKLKGFEKTLFIDISYNIYKFKSY